MLKIIEIYNAEDEPHLRPVVTKLKEIGVYLMNNNSFDQVTECFIKAKDASKKFKIDMNLVVFM